MLTNYPYVDPIINTEIDFLKNSFKIWLGNKMYGEFRISNPNDLRQLATLIYSEKFEDVIYCQHTGRYDKFKKAIYQYDIVKCKKKHFKHLDDDYAGDYTEPIEDMIYYTEHYSVIVYRASGFWVDAEDFGWEGEGMWDWDEMESVGNIFENPDLYQKVLEEKQKKLKSISPDFKVPELKIPNIINDKNYM